MTEIHAGKATKRARMSAWLSGDGIEIGALHNPLQVPDGARVRYVDRATVPELRRHYPELADVDLAPVSILGDAQDLSALGDSTVDFVVANHLLEHLEDPLRGLSEMHRVVRSGGILYVALPDPRATYDQDRPLTTLEHILDEHRGGTAATRRAHFEEWVDLVEPRLLDWPHVLTGRDLDREGQVRLLMELDYSIHFHVWRPETFLEVLAAARREEGLKHEIVAFEPCIAGSDDEFIIVLRVGECDSLPALPPGGLARPSEGTPWGSCMPARAEPDLAGRTAGAGHHSRVELPGRLPDDGREVPLPNPATAHEDPAISTLPKRDRMATWLQGDGIELGALHSPLQVPETAHVLYVDRLTVDDLRAQYPELADLDLVPVAHTGSAEDLSAFDDESLDFVIACHVVEHIEDPTRAVREIHRVLRPGGIFFCALPEPRITFDQHRDVTSLEHLLDDHPAGRATRRDHFSDWVVGVERYQPWWEPDPPDLDERIALLMDMDYSIHYHVWRPDTFLDYMSALRRRQGIDFELVAFEGCDPASDNEFILLLRKGVGALPASRPAPAAETGNAELAAPAEPAAPAVAGAAVPEPPASPPPRGLAAVAGAAGHIRRRGIEELRAGGPRRLAGATARWARRLGGPRR